MDVKAVVMCTVVLNKTGFLRLGTCVPYTEVGGRVNQQRGSQTRVATSFLEKKYIFFNKKKKSSFSKSSFEYYEVKKIIVMFFFVLFFYWQP